MGCWEECWYCKVLFPACGSYINLDFQMEHYALSKTRRDFCSSCSVQFQKHPTCLIYCILRSFQLYILCTLISFMLEIQINMTSMFNSSGSSMIRIKKHKKIQGFVCMCTHVPKPTYLLLLHQETVSMRTGLSLHVGHQFSPVLIISTENVMQSFPSHIPTLI